MLRVEVRKQRANFTLDAAIEVATPGTVALFGRSGCGKSTLINCIAGLLQPDRGSISIDGVTLVDTATRTFVPVEQRRLGYVFQDSRLFPHLNVDGNLRYGWRRAPAGVRTIKFDTVVALLGLEALLRRRAHELSGGERQRVALGRALLSQPRLLLLDEPLAALDAPRREEILPYLERLRDELALPMIYVSHRFDEVMRLASHVVVMDEGKIAVQGSLGEVSRHRALRSIVGDDAIGSVLDGRIVSTHTDLELAVIRVGDGELHASLPGVQAGDKVRVQLLASDVILATHPVDGLSVRNRIEAEVSKIDREDEETDLIEVAIGQGAIVLARLTRAATAALDLHEGVKVWVLIKSVSIRGHAFRAPTS